MFIINHHIYIVSDISFKKPKILYISDTNYDMIIMIYNIDCIIYYSIYNKNHQHYFLVY